VLGSPDFGAFGGYAIHQRGACASHMLHQQHIIDMLGAQHGGGAAAALLLQATSSDVPAGSAASTQNNSCHKAVPHSAATPQRATTHHRRSSSLADSLADLAVPTSLGDAARQAAVLTGLALQLLTFVGIGWKWVLQATRLAIYAILLLPGFAQMILYYFTSPRVLRALPYGRKVNRRGGATLPVSSSVLPPHHRAAGWRPLHPTAVPHHCPSAHMLARSRRSQPRQRLDLYLPTQQAAGETSAPVVIFVTGMDHPQGVSSHMPTHMLHCAG
jgi:hypothetical protein